MNNKSRYPYISSLLNGIGTIILIGLAIGAVYVLVRIYRFFLPKITIVGLIIMIPITIFVLIYGIGIITDIIRFIKDKKAAKANNDHQQY